MTGQSNPYLAVLDTCVLAPMPLCDTLLRLGEDRAFYIPKWSAEIMRELRRTLLRMGYNAGQCERRLAAMERAFPDAAVDGYEGLVEAMTNDRKDRHVLAAAVRCGAHCIVTQNRKDFPASSVQPYDLDVLTPDEFLIHQFHLNGDLLRERVARQAEVRGISMDGLLDRLARTAPGLVARLR